MSKKKKEEAVTPDSEEQIVKETPAAGEEAKDNETLDSEVEEIEESEEKEDSRLEEMTKELEELKSENSNLKDQYLRKHAEFENARKRMVRDKQESAKFANQGLLTDLIDVIDNFERAIKSSDENQDFDSFKEGIVMIEGQFKSLLESKWGLSRIEAEGKEYDPSRHEAVMMEEGADVEVPTVMMDLQSGYTLHERVIRPTKVKVGKPVAE